MVQEECRQTLFQDYMATGLKMLLESYIVRNGGTCEFPSFIDMTHTKEKEPTANEILEYVKGLFSEG